MSDEKELKREGEELAKTAVESKLGAKQLRTLHTLAKTKPLPMVEAFIQRQLSRNVSGKEAFEVTLGLLKRYGEDKAVFSKILMYANMLYDYYERMSAMKYREVAEESARRMCEQHGCKYMGLDILTDKNRIEVKVRVSGYRGDPKTLSSSIWRDIIHKDPKFQGRIWIEQNERR